MATQNCPSVSIEKHQMRVVWIQKTLHFSLEPESSFNNDYAYLNIEVGPLIYFNQIHYTNLDALPTLLKVEHFIILFCFTQEYTSLRT